MKNKKTRIIVGIIVIVLITVIILMVWLLWPSKSVSHTWQDKEFVLKNKILYLYSEKGIVWSTDREWQVEYFQIADFDNDNLEELGIVVWKEGYYGPTMPFWEEENKNDWGNHIFIYRLESGQPEIQWGSSTIEDKISSIDVGNIDEDEENELIVVHENGQDVMQWDDFGFEEN